MLETRDETGSFESTERGELDDVEDDRLARLSRGDEADDAVVAGVGVLTHADATIDGDTHGCHHDEAL